MRQQTCCFAESGDELAVGAELDDSAVAVAASNKTIRFSGDLIKEGIEK